MDSRRPLILISNDDGYMAKGINELVKFVKPLGDVVVVAPDSARSGSSCALSVHEPLHFKCLTKEEGLTVYRCSGTPADCVKLSKNTILDRKPDLILSGINHGDNSSINVHNSGTMGAVIEGCLSGIPSIGFSLCDHSEEADFTPLAHHIVEISKMVLQKGLPALTCLNVNFPKQETFNGVRVCEQAKGRWSDEFDPCPRQHDPNYYWLAGKFLEQEPNNEKNDHWALAHGYVAITPVTVDMTAYDYIETLSSYCKAID